MGQTSCAVTCRWAMPTLFLPAPVWLSAGEAPWTCTRTAYARALETTEVCVDCPHWRPRDQDATAPDRPFEA